MQLDIRIDRRPAMAPTVDLLHKPPSGSLGSGWGMVTPAVTIQAAKEIKSLNPSVKEALNMTGS